MTAGREAEKDLKALISFVICSTSRLRVPATDDWINSQLWALCIIHLPAVPQWAEHHAATHIQ